MISEDEDLSLASSNVLAEGGDQGHSGGDLGGQGALGVGPVAEDGVCPAPLCGRGRTSGE